VTHGINYLTDTIQVALVTSSFTYNAAHEFFSDVTNEITGTGYTAGGKVMTTPVGTWDSGTMTEKFVFDDVVWTTATFTVRRAIVYKNTGTAGTSPLMGFVDLGADYSPVGVPFTLHVNAAGLITRQILAAS
jgi:hypothetical protein